MLLHLCEDRNSAVFAQNISGSKESCCFCSKYFREQRILLFLLKIFQGARNCAVFAQNIFREQRILLFLLKTFLGARNDTTPRLAKSNEE
jgi:hypothetical protein